MRHSNAEWDFMGRTFLVWSLGEMGLRNPAAKKDYLAVMDRIIAETIRLEKEQGIYVFLMPYARGRARMSCNRRAASFLTAKLP